MSSSGPADRPTKASAAEQTVLLAVPQGEDHRAAGRSSLAAIVRPTSSAAATPAALSVAPLQMSSSAVDAVAVGAEVVVVGADHHVLVGQLAAGDHGHEVGAVGELLAVGVGVGRVAGDGLGDLLQLLDQIVLREGGPLGAVVTAGELVGREGLDHLAHLGEVVATVVSVGADESAVVSLVPSASSAESSELHPVIISVTAAAMAATVTQPRLEVLRMFVPRFVRLCRRATLRGHVGAAVVPDSPGA